MAGGGEVGTQDDERGETGVRIDYITVMVVVLG